MSSAVDLGPVEVSVPARTDYLQLLRLNVAGLAAAAFDVEAVEDLKIAVEELSAVLIRLDGADELVLRFTIRDGALVATGRRADAGDGPVELDEFLPTVLGAVVDEFDVDRRDGAAYFRFEKRLRDT